MKILLVGKSSSVTNTIHTMLRSVDEWSTKLHSDLDDFNTINKKKSDFNLLIANLEDFRRTPTKVISQIRSYFPDTPLLVVHSYLNKTLIKPMIKAGATGYIQNEASDSKLIKAAQKVVSGKECIIAEYT
jgi:DNA-binding NarL/FixJ family response regulator